MTKRDNPKNPLGEFAREIGETQRSGDAKALGLARSADVPGTGPLPSVDLPMQVQSVFDTRPVDAYDFAFELVGTLTAGSPDFQDFVEVPLQYTAVLRRVEFEFYPPYSGSVDGQSNSLNFWFERNLIRMPNNGITLRGSYSEYTWDTHQVFGHTQQMGLGGHADFVDPAPLSGGTVFVVARLFGTLVLSRGRRPQVEVGSPPVFVRPPVVKP